MRSKVMRVVMALMLTVVGVLGFATSASAATSDCFPASCSGVYKSYDGHQGGWAGWDAKPNEGSRIYWPAPGTLDYATGKIHIVGDVQDVYPDGDGPVLRIKIDYIGDAFNPMMYRWHWTGGNGTWHHYDSVLDDGVGQQMSGNYEVSFQMCNGLDSNGNEKNCEPGWHGPFHNY